MFGKIIPATAISLLALAATTSFAGETHPDRTFTDPPPTKHIPTITPAEIDDYLQIGGQEIDARKLRSRMTVDVHINDAGPFRFVVDSGADTSVVGQRVAKQLSLPAFQPAFMHTLTESRMVERVLVNALRLGPTTTLGLRVPVLRESDIGGDGIIGLDALVSSRLMMDFERRVISVDDSGAAAEDAKDSVVVEGRQERGQLILTKLRMGLIKLDAVVDTGSELTIGNSALRQQLFRRGEAKFIKGKIFGVTGSEAEIELALVPMLRIGPITLENVPIAFADVPPFAVFGLDKKPALMLGTDLMENFRRVSLDFAERKVRFQLRECTQTSVRVSTYDATARLSSDKRSVCNT